jgi:hypothetical protein
LNIQLSVTLYLLIILFIACDPDLFKPKDESPEPEVGEIQSNLSAVFVGDTVKFWVIASDPDGGTLNYIWNANAGEFITSSEEDSVLWRAPFQGGDYTVQVNVANKYKSVTKKKTVRVVSLDKPVVKILSPLDQQYLVLYETTKIEAEAINENEILYVEFFVNDSSIEILNGKETNIYSMDWIIKNNVGVTEIKVSATAKVTDSTNADSIIVNIEGVIPGKR